MNGDQLKIFADNDLVWEGSIGSDAMFDGPVGIRSDNARLELQLRAPRSPDTQTGHAPGCRAGPGEFE